MFKRWFSALIIIALLITLFFVAFRTDFTTSSLLPAKAADDPDKAEAAKEEGVCFYDEPHEKTEHGCETDTDSWVNDYDEWEEKKPEYPEYPDPDDYETDDEWEEALEAYDEAVEEYYDALEESAALCLSVADRIIREL